MEDTEDFIANSEMRLKDIITAIGWNYDEMESTCDVMPSSDFVQCPRNAGHRIKTDRLEAHLESCNWQSDGYNLDDVPLPESIPCRYSVAMTPELQDSVIENASLNDNNFVKGSQSNRSVPKTSNKLLEWFTLDERLAMYDYVIANTDRKISLAEFEFKEPGKTERVAEMTEIEKAAAERDAKRRRASYRNKVHTNRKTHTEILREVIESQLTTVHESTRSDVRPSDVDDCTSSVVASSTGQEERGSRPSRSHSRGNERGTRYYEHRQREHSEKDRDAGKRYYSSDKHREYRYRESSRHRHDIEQGSRAERYDSSHDSKRYRYDSDHNSRTQGNNERRHEYDPRAQRNDSEYNSKRYRHDSDNDSRVSSDHYSKRHKYDSDNDSRMSSSENHKSRKHKKSHKHKKKKKKKSSHHKSASDSSSS